MAATKEQIESLRSSTPEDEIKHRRAPGMGDKTLSYIDARYVEDFLDAAVGPQFWQDDYKVVPGGILGGIGIFCEMGDAKTPAQWVWKWDVGTASTIEEVKGTNSDAFKRAAVKWGVARDLYDAREEEVAATRQNAPQQGYAAPQQAQGYPAAPAAATRPVTVQGASQPGGWACPIHGTSEVWPAGIGKKSGRPYPPFTKCGTSIDDGSQWGTRCEQQPPKGYVTLPPQQPQAQGPRPTATLPNGQQVLASHAAMPQGGWQQQDSEQEDLPF